MREKMFIDIVMVNKGFCESSFLFLGGGGGGHKCSVKNMEKTVLLICPYVLSFY